MTRIVRVSRRLAVLVAALALAGCSSSTTPSVASLAMPSAIASPTPLATAQPSQAAAPTGTRAPVVAAGESWIAFQQFKGKSTIMLVRPDGSGLHSPTAEVAGGDQTNPDWSPDGSQLVFVVADGAHEVLWVVRADGTGARLLADCQADCAYLDDPAWSPDGRSVLFSRNGTGDGGAIVSTLEQIDVPSGRTVVIARADPAHFYAGQRWSPDGTSIVVEVVQLAGMTAASDVVDVSLAVIDVASPTPGGRELLGSERFPRRQPGHRTAASSCSGRWKLRGRRGRTCSPSGPTGPVCAGSPGTRAERTPRSPGTAPR